MRRIYHLVPKSTWEQAPPGPYRPSSLAAEGFIHCSNHDQVAAAANRFYGEEKELLVLCIDTSRLHSPLLDEEAGTGKKFPHIYGPLEREAVVEVQPLQRGADRGWLFPVDSTTQTEVIHDH